MAFFPKRSLHLLSTTSPTHPARFPKERSSLGSPMGRGKRSFDRCLFRDRVEDRQRCAPPRSPRTNRKGPLEGIGRTPHSATAGTVENMRVNHGRPQILVAQEILNCSNIIPVLD